jgi:hypothetical protein
VYLANHAIPCKMVGFRYSHSLLECPDSRLPNSSACFTRLTPSYTCDLKIKWYTNDRECEDQHPESELHTDCG